MCAKVLNIQKRTNMHTQGNKAAYMMTNSRFSKTLQKYLHYYAKRLSFVFPIASKYIYKPYII